MEYLSALKIQVVLKQYIVSISHVILYNQLQNPSVKHWKNCENRKLTAGRKECYDVFAKSRPLVENIK